MEVKLVKNQCMSTCMNTQVRELASSKAMHTRWTLLVPEYRTSANQQVIKTDYSIE